MFLILIDATPVPTSAGTERAPGAPPPSADDAADFIRKLVPDGSPVANAMDGMNAIKRGDAKGAIKSVLKIIPAGPLTKAIAGVLDLF